jgi:hypothetical protein
MLLLLCVVAVLTIAWNLYWWSVEDQTVLVRERSRGVDERRR